jgi:hypothetical protein
MGVSDINTLPGKVILGASSDQKWCGRREPHRHVFLFVFNKVINLKNQKHQRYDQQ